MSVRRLLPALVLLGACLLVAGCGSGSDDGGTSIEVDLVAASDTVSAADGLWLVASVENAGDERVEFGPGSSSCRVALHFARVPGGEPAGVVRACTADWVEWFLDPGDSIDEPAVLDLSNVRPGTYRVHGSLGDRAESEPIVVVIQP